jgi:hypothetical protein
MTAPQPVVTSGSDFVEKTIIVQVVKNQDPLSFPLTMEPSKNWQDDIVVGFLLSIDPKLIYYVLITLLETGGVARVDP